MKCDQILHPRSQACRRASLAVSNPLSARRWLDPYSWVRREVAQVMVHYEETSINRTCGSVRSSLAAPARLVTAGSEAAATTPLGLRARRRPRGSLRNCQRQRGWRARLDDMPNPGELLQASLRSEQAKDADRLEPKWRRSRLPISRGRHTDRQDCRCSRQGLNHPQVT